MTCATNLLGPTDRPLPLGRGTASIGARPSPRAAFLNILLLFLVALAVTHALWSPALLAGHSAWFDLARMVEFDAAIRAGDLFPTWSPDLYSGYGSPLFQFYAPLAYYFTELPVLAGLGFPSAIKVTYFLALWASGLAMYRLAATHFSPCAARLAAVLYMVAPYRLVDLYVRHALAEHCAFIWLPIIIWSTERFLSPSRRTGLITGALAIAALILTHNIMALIGLPVCLGAGWALAFPRRGWGGLLPTAALGAFGIGLAAFFWWPAMSGRPWTQAETSLTGGYFDFHRHFVRGWQFLDPRWGFGSSAGRPGDFMSLQIGLPHLFCGLAGGALFCLPWPRLDGIPRRPCLWTVAGVLIALLGIFMCSPWSQPLWEILPLVKYVQFPWRFLALVVLGTAMCGAALVDRLGALREGASAVTSLLGLVVVLATYFPYYSDARFLVVDTRTRNLAQVPAETVDALQSTARLLPIGRDTTPADLRAMRERATSGDDFLPVTVREKPDAPPTEIIHSPHATVRTLSAFRQNGYRGRVTMPAPGRVELSQFWFPGWQASVDGRFAITTPTGPQATVSCEAPAGEHLVEFRYTALPARRPALLISLGTALLLIGVVLWLPRIRPLSA